MGSFMGRGNQHTAGHGCVLLTIGNYQLSKIGV